MKTKLLTIASLLTCVALSVSSAGPAHAAMVAGWDFSQYFADGILSIDGNAYTGVLSANYSDLDPTQGAGAESAAFGTLYLDGQFGSTNVQPGSGSEPILPSGALGRLAQLQSRCAGRTRRIAFLRHTLDSRLREPGVYEPPGDDGSERCEHRVRGQPELRARDRQQLVGQLRRQDLQRRGDGGNRLLERRCQLLERRFGDPEQSGHALHHEPGCHRRAIRHS